MNRANHLSRIFHQMRLDLSHIYEIGRFSAPLPVLDGLATCAERRGVLYGFDHKKHASGAAALVFFGAYPAGVDAEEKMLYALQDAGLYTAFLAQNTNPDPVEITPADKLPMMV